jgi:Secretion system C-terminal sorting domain
MNVFPNPVATTLTANIVSEKTMETEIHILNYDGKRVADRILQAQVGENQVTFDVSNLPTGMYFMNVVGQKGENTTKKFVVVHE